MQGSADFQFAIPQMHFLDDYISLFLHDTPRIRLDIRHIVIGIYCRRNFFSTVTMVHMNLLFYKFHSPSTVQSFSLGNYSGPMCKKQ